MGGDRQPLPPHACDLMRQLAAAVGEDRFRLFGGAALDLLNDPTARPKDIDLALPLYRLRSFRPSTDLEVEPEARPYWIRKSEPVVMLQARLGEISLDLNFLDRTDKIGHFDVETVTWNYPELTYSDPCGVVGKPVRTFRLLTTPECDNPLLLINRIVKLSSKYNVPFWRHRHLIEVVAALSARLQDWRPSGAFHGEVAFDAHLRAIAASVRRAKRPAAFIDGRLQAGVLDARLSPLANSLRRDPSLAARLAMAGSDGQFWRCADDQVAFGNPAWRQYQGEGKCVSAS